MAQDVFEELRNRLNDDPALARECQSQWAHGTGALAQWAGTRGYTITQGQLDAGIAAAAEEELSPFELELVSGGDAALKCKYGSNPTGG